MIPSSTDSAIRAEHITKMYGKGESAYAALRNITVSIQKGEVVAIVGKSGSGKSTLMHVLALLDTPTEGSVYVDGEDASRLTSKQLDELRNKRFGFVFQQFFLNENDTALNNVTLPLKIGKMGRSERNQRGLQALAAVELQDKATTKAGALSGGQKQRVCIARALVNQPGVIFADEPTGNLDSHTGKIVEDMLFKLNKDQGITVIIVTHDEHLAARCERQIHIYDGAVVKRGGV
jgi:putative ABC transport system ATP-binding protein